MNLWCSAAGMMEVELTSAEPETALAEANRYGITIYRVSQVSDLTLRFRIHRKDYRALSALAKKRGDTLQLYQKMGMYWGIARWRKRPVLAIAVIFLLVLVLYFPSRVLFVRVEGNHTVPAREILAAAESIGIRFFASRKEVRSEKIKNALLSAVPQLQWAGVNTRGCVAVISVRERTVPKDSKTETGVQSILASRDGIVYSCTATRGNLLCQPGQAVKSGQVLISGYTDCGLFLRSTQAEGEIYAWTRRDFSVISLRLCTSVHETGTRRHKYSLIIGKKRINLWKDSGISDTSCGRMYSEYYVTLPGGFVLPFALAVETVTLREQETVKATPSAEALAEFSRNYLRSQMLAGKITSSNVSFLEEEQAVFLTGSYVCLEMIGRVQQEQIGEAYVKND